MLCKPFLLHCNTTNKSEVLCRRLTHASLTCIRTVWKLLGGLTASMNECEQIWGSHWGLQRYGGIFKSYDSGLRSSIVCGSPWCPGSSSKCFLLCILLLCASADRKNPEVTSTLPHGAPDLLFLTAGGWDLMLVRSCWAVSMLFSYEIKQKDWEIHCIFEESSGFILNDVSDICTLFLLGN